MHISWVFVCCVSVSFNQLLYTRCIVGHLSPPILLELSKPVSPLAEISKHNPPRSSTPLSLCGRCTGDRCGVLCNTYTTEKSLQNNIV